MISLIDFMNVFKKWSYTKEEDRVLFDEKIGEQVHHENGVLEVKKI